MERHIIDACSKGAEVVVGGVKFRPRSAGHFFSPSVLTGINKDMLISNEETFGPVAPIMK